MTKDSPPPPSGRGMLQILDTRPVPLQVKAAFPVPGLEPCVRLLSHRLNNARRSVIQTFSYEDDRGLFWATWKPHGGHGPLVLWYYWLKDSPETTDGPR